MSTSSASTRTPRAWPAPAASVVLPTHGRRASVLRVLAALACQRTPPGTFEVLVICDGDVDGTGAACGALVPEVPYRLRVLAQARQGPAAARNRGVAAARGELLLFLDDDVVPDEGWVGTHLAAHAGQERLVSIGPLLPPPATRLSVWCAWEERALCRQYDAMNGGRWQATWRQFYTGNAAVRAGTVREVGGFDASFRRAEDIELALRLHERGTRFRFLPEARGWHYVTRPFAAWLRVPAGYGAADVAMARAGRPWLLRMMAQLFQTRSGSVRVLARLCVGRPLACGVAGWLLRGVILAAERARLAAVGRVGCSLLFNLRYYDAFAAAVGGRAVFLRVLRDGSLPDMRALPSGRPGAEAGHP